MLSLQPLRDRDSSLAAYFLIKYGCNDVDQFLEISHFFITDIKRWNFEKICRDSQKASLPLVFFNNAAQLNFRIRQKISAYFFSFKTNQTRYICHKGKQQMLQQKCPGFSESHENIRNFSSKMYSLQLNPTQFDSFYDVSHISI